MKIVLTGYGRMGHMIEQVAQEKGHEITGRVDVTNVPDLKTMPEADVVIDFSHPAMLEAVEEYVKRTGAALVSGTTGYDESHMERLQRLSEFAPVVHSANYSMGIALFRHLLQQMPQALLENFDIEILEKHHNKKVDAPSGTALALADAINETQDMKYAYSYDRSQERKPREKQEIGISAVRGGTIVGEHEVLFAGEDEVIEFKHTAYSKAVFAKGALEAAKFLAGKPAGKYDMSDVISF